MRRWNSPAVEPLEARRLLSVTVAESEPNGFPPDANPVPRVVGESVHFIGALDAPGDFDFVRIDLQAGDVFGASMRGAPGLDGMIAFGKTGPDIFNDDSFSEGGPLPGGSPLPHQADDIRDPEVYCVVSTPGTYFIQLSAFVDPDTGETSTGAYDLEIVVARPGMESKPVGAKQILFLDFDGGSVEYDLPEGPFVPAFEPFVNSLSRWGLPAGDLNRLVKETIKRTTAKLYTFIAANGLNGDYAKSRTPGEFGLEIRNSFDHPDPGDDPLASKIVLGRTDSEFFATVWLGSAQHIDVGNFQQNDQAAISTNFIEGLLRDFPIAKPGNRSLVVDFVAEYMTWFICHEFAHLVGVHHTAFTFENSFNEPANLMDKDIRLPMGADLVFGTPDDVIAQFGVDAYDPHERYQGVNDTLNTLAFGLSTGTVRRNVQGPGTPPITPASIALIGDNDGDDDMNDDDELPATGRRGSR